MTEDKFLELKFDEGRDYSIEVTHNIDGFLISYHEISFDGVELEKIPIKPLLGTLEEIMRVLMVKPSSFLLEIIPNGGRAATCSVDNRNIVHVVLPVNLRNGQIVLPSRGLDENYILYHELMHAKDVLEGRDPSSGLIDIETDFGAYLSGLARDFSIEGRLKRMDLPHCPREQSIKNAIACLDDIYEVGLKRKEIAELLRNDFCRKLCDNTWGKELTSKDVDVIIKQLM